jgi:hypothetical protein
MTEPATQNMARINFVELAVTDVGSAKAAFGGSPAELGPG